MHYNTDLLDENTGGYKFLSHVVFNKLSRELRKELKAKTANDFPTFKEIMENHASVIQNIISIRAPKKGAPPVKSSKGSVGKAGAPALNFGTQVQQADNVQTSSNSVSKGNKSAGASSTSNSNYTLHCRFCEVDGHSNLRCRKYLSVEDRVEKCKKLGICHHCTSLKHSGDKCLGLRDALWKACRFCNSYSHIQALCPDPKRLAFIKSTEGYLCLSTNSLHQTNYLLPVIALNLQ